MKLSGKQTKTSYWMLLFVFILAGIFLYFALRGMDWKSFGTTILNGKYQLLPITIGIVSINCFLRSQRWGILVTAEKKIPPITVFWATMVGYLGNAYLPARAGEMLRSVMLGKKTSISISFILATALTERIVDVIALVLISAFSLFFIEDLREMMFSATWIMALIGLVGLICVFIVPIFENKLILILQKFPLNEKLKIKLVGLLEQFLNGIRTLQNSRRALKFVFFTILIWLIDGISAMVVALIIHQNLSLAQSLFFLASLGLSSALPSTPGYLGVYQFVAVTVLTPFGYSQGEALAYILVSQATNYLVITFWGLIGLWRLYIVTD